MENELLHENIFNRCIFGKSTQDEMLSNLEYYTNVENYEKCIVIKELIDLQYFTDDPKKDDIDKLTIIINEYQNDLNNLIEMSGNLKNLSENYGGIDNIKTILNDIDNISDDIIYSILESDKLRRKYLKLIYDDIVKVENDFPPVKKEKSKKLLISYREQSIKNIKKVINSIEE